MLGGANLGGKGSGWAAGIDGSETGEGPSCRPRVPCGPSVSPPPLSALSSGLLTKRWFFLGEDSEPLWPGSSSLRVLLLSGVVVEFEISFPSIPPVCTSRG